MRDFDKNEETRRRLHAQAEAILPGRRHAALLEGEQPGDSVDLVQCVRPAGGGAFAGFERIAMRPFRQPEPLHEAVARASPGLGRVFAPGGMFSHVGGRTCLRPAAELVEETWLRRGAGFENEVSLATASPLALAWITAGGLGFLPVVGATMASLGTALAGWGVGWVWGWEAVRMGALVVAGVATVASLCVERASARHFLSDDAREFVLDEVAGMALTLAFVPVASGSWGIALAFAAFRFFDVLKPGIRWIEERHWRGTIVWDDLLAGLYGGVSAAALAGTALYLPL